MDKLIEAMKSVNDLNKSHGVVQRGGKKYTEVAVRIEAFRLAFGVDLGIDTSVLVDDGKRVVVKAVITNVNGRILGSGMAEEIRGSSNVNKTSALENGETSAIGRALASLGLHGGTYASANEMAAVARKEAAQKETPAPRPQRQEPEHEMIDELTIPPAGYSIYNHAGDSIGGPRDIDVAMKDLIALLKKYAETTVTKAGERVAPRQRMSMVHAVSEANQHIIQDLSDAGMQRYEVIYRKILAHLGAQQKEWTDDEE